MRSDSQPHSQWAQLSIELWNLTFTSVASKASVWDSMSDLYTLPLVCKRFSDVFKQHPHLCDTVRFHSILSDDNLTALLSWIQHHGAFVRHCAVCDSPRQETVLGALLSHGAPLQTVWLNSHPRPVHTELHMIGAFRKLTHCTIDVVKIIVTDLRPMQNLPSLVDLELVNGEFENLDAAAVRLTSLRLLASRATCSSDCGCVTSLVELKLHRSKLARVHSSGIAACQSLTSLACNMGVIQAVDDARTLSFGPQGYTVPEGISSLTSLVALTFNWYVGSSHVGLHWLTSLTALQFLHAYADQSGDLLLPECISTMTTLRILSLTSEPEGKHIKPCFNWKGLVSLEDLYMKGALNVEFCDLSGLATLSNLQVVKFSGLQQTDAHMTVQLAQLAHKLGKTRPNVEFSAEL